jgi:hypothetical protein
MLPSVRFEQAGRGGAVTCYKHPNADAVARCEKCGREICASCVTYTEGKAYDEGKVVCPDCAAALRGPPEPVVEQPQPAVEQPQPEAPAAKEPIPGPVNVVKPSGPVPGEASGVPAPAPPSTIALSTPSPPPAVSDLGAGGPREKESILSAALSLLLPGAGQIYNGQIVKGIILAALYIGCAAVIFGGAVVTIVSASYFNTPRSVCCCCLPLFILPLVLLVYAIYDAYNTAEKINNHEAVRDWL